MIDLFGKILRNARRASGLGLLDFKQPASCDAAWELLVKGMWRYQWVTNPKPLTPELFETIYDLTQGVTDFLAKLMILGQKHAIQSGLETLDAGVFKHVAATKMKLLLPAIAALRSKDPMKLSKFEDLLPTDEQLERMMIDDVVLGPDRRASLLRQQLEARSAENSIATPGDSSGAKPAAAPKVVSQSSHRTVPLSAGISGHSNPLHALREAKWILGDPFEFVPAYRA
jgi:hypothetical protein